MGSVDAAKRLLLGRAITSAKAEHQLLPKTLALPVFASDQLSSVAYATEEMMLVLALAGAGALLLKVPLALGVGALLIIVIVSYRQTVKEYPRGGGSYIVARENLGTIPGLTAAAAILTSYVLTVAVSVTAGAIAVTSAIPELADAKVWLAVAFIVVITIANLRGAKEAGTFFAIPTYGFVFVVMTTLAYGAWRCATEGCPRADTAELELEAVAGLSVFLVARAFSSGATALTGVEAIADGVQAFRRPQSRNAAATLAVMGAMSIPMFLGITAFATLLHVRVDEEIAATRSVLSQVGQTIHEGGAGFIVLQVFTALILILAANTAYQDFPRLSSILARDRFMPSQFRNRGNRLVFSNGIVALSLLAALLVWLFGANLSRLIQLYVVGVFTAITLSQTGMVRRMWTRRPEGWRPKALMNAIGSVTTGAVLVVIIATRFMLGAWMVVVAVPIIIVFFLTVHRHYEHVHARLRTGGLTPGSAGANTFVLAVSDLSAATTNAVSYVLSTRSERVIPLYVGDGADFDEVRQGWGAMAPSLPPLTRLDRDGRKLRPALRTYLREHREGSNDFLTLVLPEWVGTRSAREYVRERSTLLLKASLLFEPGIVVADVPLLPSEVDDAEARRHRPVAPRRSVVIVPVPGVHDGVVRAVDYASSLRAAKVEAVFFAADPEEVPVVATQWSAGEMEVPLAIVDAPFRDIGPPLLDEVRSHTSTPGTIVTVVLPESVVERWWEHLLHNQTGLYIKRLLLFEPGVVVTSVPFHVTPGHATAVPAVATG